MYSCIRGVFKMGEKLEIEGFVSPKTQMISELVERYRTRLLENYKKKF